MDHARHLAPSSPNSSFLFHHSERSFKSSLLTPPHLTSANDVSHQNVNDCFSLTTTTTTTSTTTTNTSNNQNNLSTRLQESFGDNHDERNEILVNHHDDSNQNVTNIAQTDDHLDHDHHHHQNHCVISSDSLNGVANHHHHHDVDEVDDGMHNMLSGSSTSSTATIPLLGDNHSHNPFSRISLSEYSPLSLVDDCDNALTISPTSLVCGSHHSFKSSLNNLKLETIDGVDVNVDDVVGDARSMSPSLLSTNTNSNHQNQSWSISSTAITQNPALLNNSSSSFLLSHHHHHQLNSLMHQLEPQSLDESPPLIGHGLLLDTDQLSHNHHHHHRPSSEPPPASDLLLDIGGHIETKSGATKQNTSSQAAGSKSKQQQNKSKPTVTTSTNSAPTTSSNKSSRKNRNKTPKNKQQADEKLNRQEQEKKKAAAAAQMITPPTDSSYSSKAHLQLNHHQKLKELQQRLFGPPTTSTTATSATTSSSTTANQSQSPLASVSNSTTSSGSSKTENVALADKVQPLEPEGPVTTTEISALNSTKPTEFVVNSNGTITSQSSESTQGSDQQSPAIEKLSGKSRFRRTPKRKTKTAQNELGNSSSPPSGGGGAGLVGSSVAPQKSVTTESVEPDTTTKSSDCIKLADLLSTSSSIDSNSINPTIILSNNSTNGADFSNLCDQAQHNDTKRIQHIQLQVSPSLKFMANGSLVQSMSLQQQLTNNVAIVSSGCGSFSNQVICRPVNVMTTVSGANNNGATSDEQAKCNNTTPANDWSKSGGDGGGGATLSTCMGSNQSNHTMNGAAVSALNNAIGAHQIAIQVICQDGTSLVLPVSAASGLSAGLSQGPNQQLQAVLSNGMKNGVSLQQRQTNQMMPLISVSNILAQQQQQTNGSQATLDTSANISDSQSSSQTNGSSTQSTGLAASSPTLAALLDAGSNRANNDSANLLRKCVGGSVELKRGEFNLQPGTQIGLTNNGSLVTICATNSYSNAGPNHSVNNSSVKLNHGATQCLGDKRIKLENVQEVGGNIQTTFTLIEPQNVIVANGNDGKLLQAEGSKPADTQQVKLALGLQSLASDTSNSISTLQQQLNSTTASMKTTNSDNAASNSGKQNKMASSTGNRPVDPTQPFRCEHCNSTFTRLGNFTRHKKIHSAPTKDGQRFKCDVCSKSFLQRCDLARHLHIHRGTEPHRCNICGKGYIRHSDLVTHQRFHNKEKPFGCPNCHKGFCQRGDLNRHLRSIHLQLKPLLCPCCNRKFAKRDTLLKHLSTHHRQYPIEMLPP